MGNAEICAFLTDLASTRVTFNTQAQAMHSLLWLYKSVLKQDVGWLEGFERARKPEHVPVILSTDEVDRLLANVAERVPSIVLRIQYGTGARLSEAIALRVKDVDFSLNEITVKDGKGGKDRHLPLPDALRAELQEQVRRVRLLHDRDLSEGQGAAAMPNRLAVKYAARSKELGWQYLFPSRELFVDRETHRAVRGHVSDRRIQRAFNEARRRARIFKHVGTHSLRHAFATHTLQAGYDIRTVQELLGHRDVKTTMIYTHVLNRGGMGVLSPLDRKACVIARADDKHVAHVIQPVVVRKAAVG